MSKKVCPECGAVIKKAKRHRRWHRLNRPIPGPQGPPGPQGMAGPQGPRDVHTTWEDVKRERAARSPETLLDAVLHFLDPKP